MPFADLNGTRIHYQLDGPATGATVVFAHALGTDLRIWDAVLPKLPAGLRLLRFDLRGHGQSHVPPAPYTMGQLIKEAEALIEHVGARDCLFVGLSIGGMIAQGLAAKRLDLVRALVLSNTAAKIATRDIWASRIAHVKAGGMDAVTEDTLKRWFAKGFYDSPMCAPWREMLLHTPPQGWMGCAAAIAGTDFISTTSALRLPCLGIAGTRDQSTPPDLLRETVGMIPGSDVVILHNSGHIPPIDAPDAYAKALTDFIIAQGFAE